MARKPKQPKRTPIEAHEHTDTRLNIPTRQQAAMLDKDEARPKTLRYPRDDSLDPQFVWTGKDEQDGSALEVPSVPIYIQEKIQPKAIIEDFCNRSRRGETPGTIQRLNDRPVAVRFPAAGFRRARSRTATRSELNGLSAKCPDPASSTARP